MELLELETDPDERNETVQLITDEIERMNVIVEDLLLLARAERPGFLTITNIDVAELSDDVFRKASLLCPREWRLSERADVTIAADAQRLAQAWMQLAENACRHTAPDIPIRFGSSSSNGIVTLWIHDLGAGVRPEDTERIFERFVKGIERTQGSGLGLSIVAAIAEAHGGRAACIPDLTLEPGSRSSCRSWRRRRPGPEVRAFAALSSALDAR